MELRYNVKGEARKKMVEEVSVVVGMYPIYSGVPTFNYIVGNFTITRDGTITFEERKVTDKQVEKIKKHLAEAGFELENEPEATEDDEIGLEISVPRTSLSDEAIENIKRIAASKAGLFKKAFGADDLSIEVDDTRVTFPWFPDITPDSAQTYMHFIEAICDMARNQTRITAKEKEVENEKYAFRCFLLRLGFIGAEYKADRKTLLKNLSGSAAFKSGAKGGED